MNLDVSDKENIQAWNRHVRMAPKDFYNAICQPPLENSQMRLTLSLWGDMSVNLSRHGNHRELEFDLHAEFDLQKRTGTFNYMEVSAALQGKGIGSSATTRLFNLVHQMGVCEIRTEASLANGGYTWARLGFMPGSPKWPAFSLKDEYLIPRMKTFSACIPEHAKAQLEAAIASDDPTAIFLIASLKTPTHNVPVGRWLLAHSFFNPHKEPSPHIFMDCWTAMRTTALARLEKTGTGFSPKTRAEIAKAINIASPENIPNLLDLPHTLSGIPLGKLMLVGTKWQGILDFNNPIQAKIFHAAMERNLPRPKKPPAPPAPHPSGDPHA
ncbi:MAG TPA: hypothetical protein DCW68_02910 [Rhodospirillaceae bacterium]|nr:MAG: hypothetical protein A2018_05885 [Alphaproteobacteria bacterium GWF2_58_20]HAU29042.1 hypothetical protein [Rhodospirillaceae bacterium]